MKYGMGSRNSSLYAVRVSMASPMLFVNGGNSIDDSKKDKSKIKVRRPESLLTLSVATGY